MGVSSSGIIHSDVIVYRLQGGVATTSDHVTRRG